MTDPEGDWLIGERSKMMRHLISKGVSIEDAEDLVGRSLQEYLEKVRRGAEVRHQSGLLWRILRCNLSDSFRQKARRPFHTTLDAAHHLSLERDDPSLNAVINDLLEQLGKRLSREERIAFVDFHMHRFSDRQIAAIINIREAAVRVKRHRAAVKIQRMLNEDPPRRTP